MEISAQTFPSQFGEIKYFTLVNAAGASVTLSNLGAGIVSVNVPDAEGNMADVVLGYKNPADFMADGPCAGKVPGRFANRIALGKFTLDGKEYSLAINNGPNALHGGPTGFQNRLWNAETPEEGKVVFTYRAADGEEGYPGNLDVRATYEWTDASELILTLEAATDAPTVVNLTNHVYFNLDGHASGSVLDHELTIRAEHYLPTDSTQIPTGELAPVAGTPMDFRTPKAIGADIKADFEPLHIGKGYDHCWALDGYEKGKMQPVAELRSPKSGRKVVVSTTQPGLQVYTGNWLAGCPESKAAHAYADYDGVALECQGFPDAPNKPSFPTPTLLPGEAYKEVISFKFA